jgi:predicted secreted hydrolase
VVGPRYAPGVGRIAAGTAVALCLAFAPGAAGTPHVRFPRDHYGHPGSSIEWWYFTALAHDRAGVPYSVFFTLFASRGALVPLAQVRNLRTGALVGHSEALALGTVGRSSLDVTTDSASLRFEPRPSLWSFSASANGFAVSLRQRPEKPYALHGDGGVIRQSVAGSSHYYSSTRMRASGTLRVGGRTIALTGQSWLDHQWGGFRDDPRAFDWDWFSCRFGDGSELMLYQFRDRKTGRPLARFRNGTYVAKDGRATTITRFTATAGPRALDAAGRRWPLDWRLDVPALHLFERLASVLRDQLVRNRVVPTFWEGVSRATGTRTGDCFVELSYR